MQIRALGQEYKFKNSKENYRTHRSNILIVGCEYDSFDDEDKDVHVAEFLWTSKAKSYSCSLLKPSDKNGQEEVLFTSDISRCDRIFDELLKNGSIKLSYAIPLLDELKRRANRNWHNCFSKTTNDYNVFCQQVQ